MFAFFDKEELILESDVKATKIYQASARLGTEVNPNADDIELLEKYACFLYGFPSVTKINDARSKGFRKYFEEEEEWLI